MQETLARNWARVKRFRPKRFVAKVQRKRNGLDGRALDVRRARLRVRDAPIVIECGANDGSDTRKFLERWQRAEVHCFEPEPRASALWRERVSSPRAHLYEAALAAADGEAVFHRSSGEYPHDPARYPGPWNQSGSIRPPTGHLDKWPWVRFEEELTVRTRSLDSWAREHGVEEVDLVWADVQGAEEDLVRGGLETLARTRYFYTEVSDVEFYEGQIGLDGLLRLLPRWKVLARYPGDVLLVNTRMA